MLKIARVGPVTDGARSKIAHEAYFRRLLWPKTLSHQSEALPAIPNINEPC